MKGSLNSIRRRRFDMAASRLQRPWSQGALDHERMYDTCSTDEQGQSYWATMPPELLRYIIQKVDECRSAWPLRIDVVACASVCKAWRDATKDVVRGPEFSGKLTFPVSVMQPGPRDSLLQCFITRDRITLTYQLYLSLTSNLAENGKFLLAARKLRRVTGSDYIISLDAIDRSQGSESYVGKLRSNFLGTKFTIHENFSLDWDPATSMNRPCKRVAPKPFNTCQNSSGILDVAQISYELNIVGNKGPRRMNCTLYSVPRAAVEESGVVPSKNCASSSVSLLRSQSPQANGVISEMETLNRANGIHAPLTLKNRSPRWHEQLQCWCLNFKGRVTVASVKNFQLVAVRESSQADEDKVLLQFGKVGKDMFTMDYRYPLSAFQAFAICLSSFDTKLASE